jgi:putative membrane protein
MLPSISTRDYGGEMSERDFFQPAARKRVGEAVEAIERGTSAEVVVTVRKRAGHYRQTDLYAGSGVALGMLVFLLFDEHPFDIGWMPVNVVIAFLVAAVSIANVAGLRRALTSPRVLAESARTAARAAFYDLGISRTTGRTGILVFVSMFERRVEVVGDVAIEPKALGAEWTAVERALQAAIDPPDLDAFLTAMGTMSAPLARVLPIQPDDVNELPNEPVMG